MQACIGRGWRASRIIRIATMVILCLGGIAWKAALNTFRALGVDLPRPQPKFAHGAEVELDGVVLMGCYHVSQQNTFTGRLTESMLDTILQRARRRAGID